jgi:hypothetical protein
MLDIVVFWTLWYVGHSGMLDIVVCWTLWYVGHSGMLDIVVCWTLWYVGHSGMLDICLVFTIVHVVNTIKIILTTDFELSDWNNIVSTCTRAFHTHHECMLWSYHCCAMHKPIICTRHGEIKMKI